MRVTIARADLAAFMSADPAVLLLDDLPDTPFAALGLTAWQAAISAGAAHIGQTGGETAEVALPPAGILLVIGRGEPAPAWHAWFAASGHTPRFMAVGDAPPSAAAAPAATLLAATLLAERKTLIATAADLHRALARVRQDAEQTADVAIAMARALAFRPAGEMVLHTDANVSDEAIRLDGTRPVLLQPLGTRVDRIAAIALFIAAQTLHPADALRVRLTGMESGRVFGSWRIPGGALIIGALTLELPTPAGGAPETGMIECHFTGAIGSHLDLALDRLGGFAENKPRAPGGAEPGTQPLAVKIWCGEPGSRYVAPEHWDGEEAGAMPHPGGIPLAMPLAAFQKVRVLRGGMPKPYDPGDAMPMLVAISGGGHSLVIFPLVNVRGMDAIEARLSVRGGDVRALAASLWLQPLDRAITGDADLIAPGPDVAWSGWQSFAAAGAAHIALEIPMTSAPNLQLVLAIDASARAASGLTLIEITSVVMRAAGGARRAAVVAPPSARALPRPLALGDDAEPEDVRFHEVIADEHFDNSGAYRHLDMRLTRFSVAGLFWPFLKFRLVLEGNRACLEFRDIASWPPSLRVWPATSDQHGRFMRLYGLPAEVAALSEAAPAEDLQLIAGLTRILPGVAAKAATLAGLDAAHIGHWAEIAEQLALRLAPHAALARRK